MGKSREGSSERESSSDMEDGLAQNTKSRKTGSDTLTEGKNFPYACPWRPGSGRTSRGCSLAKKLNTLMELAN